MFHFVNFCVLLQQPVFSQSQLLSCSLLSNVLASCVMKDVFSQNVLLNPLPPKLVKPGEITRDEHFTTTTGSTHDQKHMGLVYSNQDPLYKKAPGHWKVDYNKDLHEKVG